MTFKKITLLAAMSLALIGCSNTGGNDVNTVRGEVLSENFVAENIKVKSKGCNSGGEGRNCRVISIESLATAPSNGGTETNRNNALIAACLTAESNAMRLIEGSRVAESTVTSTQVVSTEGSNSEENHTSQLDPIATSNRGNNNETVTTITRTIRRNSSGFMQGWHIKDQAVVGPQEVSCTVVWEQKNENLLRGFRNR